MRLRKVGPQDVETLRLWASQDRATAQALGPDLFATMPICYAVANGTETPVGFVGGSRIGDFLNAQIVIDPARRKGWTFNEICRLGEEKAKEEGVKVIVAAPMLYNDASRAILRWRKYLPVPVLILSPKQGSVPAMLMGKVL